MHRAEYQESLRRVLGQIGWVVISCKVFRFFVVPLRMQINIYSLMQFLATYFATFSMGLRSMTSSVLSVPLQPSGSLCRVSALFRLTEVAVLPGAAFIPGSAALPSCGPLFPSAGCLGEAHSLAGPQTHASLPSPLPSAKPSPARGCCRVRGQTPLRLQSHRQPRVPPAPR